MTPLAIALLCGIAFVAGWCVGFVMGDAGK